MACGGFTCSKNSLIALNVLYILVSFILIGVASYGRTSNYVTSISIIGGIIACGVFLLLVAILGLIGAVKHNQVFLFFYMIILFLLFLLQFGIACACLAVTKEQQHDIIQKGWKSASNNTKGNAQKIFECCGFDSKSQNLTANLDLGHPSCEDVTGCCENTISSNGTCCYGLSNCNCPPCYQKLQTKISRALEASGYIGLIFSLTEIAGAIITFRYRRMPDQGHVPMT